MCAKYQIQFKDPVTNEWRVYTEVKPGDGMFDTFTEAERIAINMRALTNPWTTRVVRVELMKTWP